MRHSGESWSLLAGFRRNDDLFRSSQGIERRAVDLNQTATGLGALA